MDVCADLLQPFDTEKYNWTSFVWIGITVIIGCSLRILAVKIDFVLKAVCKPIFKKIIVFVIVTLLNRELCKTFHNINEYKSIVFCKEKF